MIPWVRLSLDKIKCRWMALEDGRHGLNHVLWWGCSAWGVVRGVWCVGWGWVVRGVARVYYAVPVTCHMIEPHEGVHTSQIVRGCVLSPSTCVYRTEYHRWSVGTVRTYLSL